MRRNLGLLILALAVGGLLAGTVVRTAAAGPTLVQLVPPPAPAGLANVHSASCAASGFNADGTIAGVCQYTYGSSGGSGRGGGYRPVPSADYPATWSAYGQVIGLGAQCSCVRNFQGTGTVVVINGVPYYYVATDAATQNELVSSNVVSYLVLQALPSLPKAPAVTAVEVANNLQVSWTPDAATQNALTSSTVSVAAVSGSGTPLTATVNGTTTTATLGPVQPATSYLVSVVNSDSAGAGAAGTLTFSTPASTVKPGVPVISHLYWTGNLMVVNWTAPTAGDSPIDSYEISVVWADGDNKRTGPYDQVVSGQTLSAYFTLDSTSSWRVKVRAHNAAGWGAWTLPKLLGGL